MTVVQPARPPTPRRQVCPMCGHDDDVTVMPLPEGLTWQYSCSNRRHGGAFLWTVEAEARLDQRHGITAELGLYEDLPRCLLAGEPFVEHGVVEHRYKLLAPSVYFEHLLPRYGHVAQSPRRYSLSSFIAAALGRLHREGVLAWRSGPATGFFHYNGRLSYWALSPGPAGGDRLSWKSFAEAEQLDASRWSLERP